MPPRATDHKVDWRIEARPIGQVNWTGMWTLYLREVRRFFKMLLQAVLAPIVTCLLFLAIFTVAFGDGRGVAGLDYGTFLAPGLIMMSVIQQSFANCSSSLISAKIVGNIVDTMMAPLGPGELLVAYALSGVTRGLIVALGAGGALALFVDFPPVAWGWATYFVLMSALTMALAGIVAGLWSEKFDHLSTVTNFVITPLAFLSGTFYSVERLPGMWRELATVNPLFHMIDGFRYALIGWSDSAPWVAALVIAASALVTGGLCYRLLRIGYKLKT